MGGGNKVVPEEEKSELHISEVSHGPSPSISLHQDASEEEKKSKLLDSNVSHNDASPWPTDVSGTQITPDVSPRTNGHAESSAGPKRPPALYAEQSPTSSTPPRKNRITSVAARRGVLLREAEASSSPKGRKRGSTFFKRMKSSKDVKEAEMERKALEQRKALEKLTDEEIMQLVESKESWNLFQKGQTGEGNAVVPITNGGKGAILPQSYEADAVEDDDAVKMTMDVVPKGLLLPSSPFMRVWDIVVLVLMIFVIIVTPFQIAFLPESNKPVHGLFWVDRLVDVLFCVDIIINFRLAFFNEEGIVEVNPKKVFKRYFFGWFFIDLITVLPFDLVVTVVTEEDASSLGGSSGLLRFPKLLRIFRLLKLVKIFRVLRLSRIFRRWETSMSFKYGQVQIVKFFAMILVVSHWNACLFFLTETVEDAIASAICEGSEVAAAAAEGEVGEAIVYDSNCDLTTWVVYYGLENSTAADQYIASLYWAVMTATTIGYGDISARTTGERLFSLFAMISGAGLFAYVLGGLSSLVQSLDSSSVNFRRTMDDLNQYMKFRKLPKNLRMRIRQYFHHCRIRPEFIKEQEMLSGMSDHLRKEVLVHCYQNAIYNVPVFMGAGEEFVADIAMNLTPVTFGPNEFIIMEGTVPTAMFIIQKGTVHVLKRKLPRVATRTAKEKQSYRLLAVLQDGALVGESATILRRTNSRHTEGAKSVAFCDMLRLDAAMLATVLYRHPRVHNRVRKYIIRRLWKKALASVVMLVRIKLQMGSFFSSRSGGKDKGGEGEEKEKKEERAHTLVIERTPPSNRPSPREGRERAVSTTTTELAGRVVQVVNGGGGEEGGQKKRKNRRMSITMLASNMNRVSTGTEEGVIDEEEVVGSPLLGDDKMDVIVGGEGGGVKSGQLLHEVSSLKSQLIACQRQLIEAQSMWKEEKEKREKLEEQSRSSSSQQ